MPYGWASFTPLSWDLFIFVNLIGKNYLLSAGQLLSVMCEETRNIIGKNGKAGIGIFITAQSINVHAMLDLVLLLFLHLEYEYFE